MVEISDIVDEASVAALLAQQPDTTFASKIVAHRTAMRVLPIAWQWFVDRPRQDELTVIPILRASLTSEVHCYSGAIPRSARTGVNWAANAAVKSAANTVYAAGDASDDMAIAAANATAAASATSVANVSARSTVYPVLRAAADVGDDVSDALWGAFRADCAALAAGENLSTTHLWSGESILFASRWSVLSNQLSNSEGSEGSALREIDIDWSFWIEWYSRALIGSEHRWDMLKEIALLEAEVWEGDPRTLMDKIYAIAARYETDPVPSESTEGLIQVFRATLFDFSYDHVEAVMRAVPLDRDWKHLDDPDLLAAFLQDAEDLRDDLDLFCDALQSEGTAMQGAGIVRTYCAAILKELARAEEHKSLRVGKLVQYGRMLENARLDPGTQAEFGLLAPALQDNGQAVLDLMRTHFARTLGRFADLRDIGIEENASQWEVLQGFRELVEVVQTGDGTERPPLARDDAAVLNDILESVDRQMRALDATQDEGAVASLKREINFELAKLGATIAIYRERAVGAEAKAGSVADLTLTWQKRGLGLWGIVEGLKRLL